MGRASSGFTDRWEHFDLDIDGRDVAFKDVQWAYPALPEEGGGTYKLRMQTQPVGTLFLFIWFSNLIGYIPLPTNTHEKVDIFGTSAKYIDACKKAGLEPARSHDLKMLRALLSTGSPLVPESFDFAATLAQFTFGPLSL